MYINSALSSDSGIQVLIWNKAESAAAADQWVRDLEYHGEGLN